MKASLRLLAILAAATVLPAAAQNLFTYQGADRMDKIAAAAKKEGTLTLYTTIAEKDLPAIIKPFEQKYGVKVAHGAPHDKWCRQRPCPRNRPEIRREVMQFAPRRWRRVARKMQQGGGIPVQKDSAGLGLGPKGVAIRHPRGVGQAFTRRGERRTLPKTTPSCSTEMAREAGLKPRTTMVRHVVHQRAARRRPPFFRGSG